MNIHGQGYIPAPTGLHDDCVCAGFGVEKSTVYNLMWEPTQFYNYLI